MSNANFAEVYKQRIEALNKALPTLFMRYSSHIAHEFLAEVKKRTPVDYGALRNAWSLDPITKQGKNYIIRVVNTQKYAPFIELGYAQRPGMLLRMRMKRGRLRFEEFLGYSHKYGVGDPTGKVEPDENGDYYICTRKRFIKGRFMARDGLAEMKRRIPVYNRELLKALETIYKG